jgi:hypothetical protein
MGTRLCLTESTSVVLFGEHTGYGHGMRSCSNACLDSYPKAFPLDIRPRSVEHRALIDGAKHLNELRA